MGQITGVAEPTASRVEPIGRRIKDASAPVDPAPTIHGRGEDRVELSETAKRAAGGVGDTGLRTDLIERIRREIEAGTYETPDKLDLAAERIARVLDVQG